ncbi:MAG: type II toxin-antitoxin system RelE/ParE family toxin [Gammaproteobacteria bacterium]|nr:type II toxin-antitoxin system RelE/ParE family toxin [Gammaproteobacteria bacterium]
MTKMITIIEFPSFSGQVGGSISSTERDQLIDFLARQPEVGDEIPGTGGIRKLRWAGKGKGKRGGLRIIYYFYNETAPVFLLTVYGKGEQEDLTSDQKKKLMSLAKALKEECKAARKKYHD